MYYRIVIERNMAQEIQMDIEERKFIRAIGKWVLGIAGIVFSINLICRFADAKESMEYIQVMGKVVKVQSTSEWTRAGGNSFEASSYGVWVDYQPQGDPLWYTITESYSKKLFSEGETVPVLYQKGKVYKAYVAKKDWITRAYLPVSKNYNMPFIISVVLLVIGFLFYTNSPILEWYTHAGEIVIGKKKKT